jgi:hypothetical protein
MQPKSQHWIWMTLAVLALTVISYLVAPPAVIKQATALLRACESIDFCVLRHESNQGLRPRKMSKFE